MLAGIQAQQRSQQAGLLKSQAALARSTQLSASRLVSQTDLETAQAAVDSAQAQIDQLTRELTAERSAHDKTRGQLASSDAALETLGKGVAFLEALSSKNASSPAPTSSRGKQKP